MSEGLVGLDLAELCQSIQHIDLQIKASVHLVIRGVAIVQSLTAQFRGLLGIGQSVIAQLGRGLEIVQTLPAQLGEMVRIGCSANTQLSKRGELVWE